MVQGGGGKSIRIKWQNKCQEYFPRCYRHFGALECTHSFPTAITWHEKTALQEQNTYALGNTGKEEDCKVTVGVSH